MHCLCGVLPSAAHIVRCTWADVAAHHLDDLRAEMQNTGNPQLTLIMDPACSACYSKLRTKGINYNESWKL